LTFGLSLRILQVALGGSMFTSGMRCERLWRPLIGLVLAYAIAAQSFLLAFGGFVMTTPADTGAPAFELCFHNAQAAPASSDGVPSHPGCTHCIFCFAGSHHAVAAAPSALFHRVNVEIVDIPWVSNQHALPRLSDYSIASPRGPPPRG